MIIQKRTTINSLNTLKAMLIHAHNINMFDRVHGISFYEIRFLLFMHKNMRDT